jgi:nuclear cap-binding protein subunit 2
MYLDGSTLDNRIIRVDIDEGFEPGREFGKARTGGQVRDEVRDSFDLERGGWGQARLYGLEEEPKKETNDENPRSRSISPMRERSRSRDRDYQS